MCSLIKQLILIYAVTLFVVNEVSAIKCFKCSNEEDCQRPDLVQCNAEQVRETQRMFSFLPKAESQAESNVFNCVAYNAALNNSSSVSLSGCFFNTYNPCEDINAIPAKKWTCKYCDTRDGCNPASKILENVLLIGIFSIFAIYLQKLY